jgi:hypothetical protein
MKTVLAALGLLVFTSSAHAIGGHSLRMPSLASKVEAAAKRAKLFSPGDKIRLTTVRRASLGETGLKKATITGPGGKLIATAEIKYGQEMQGAIAERISFKKAK